MDAALKPGRPMGERWQIFEPWWKSIRLTGYSQAISEGIRDLLGFEELSAGTVEGISRELERRNRPGLYREVLKSRANVRLSVVNMNDLVEVDREFFLGLPRLNRFSMLNSAADVEAIERDYEADIGSLDDHVSVIRQVCGDWKAAVVAGIKLSQSYHRAMDFTERSREDAAAVYDRLLRGEYNGLNTPEGVVLEDYLVFECCRAAAESGLTIQFHMGMRAGNFGGMEGCSPAGLTELMRSFPRPASTSRTPATPYLREGAVLGKTFPNCFLNMSWIHIISPQGSRHDLKEWLRMVPSNKIIAFGDDVMHAEVVYGHLKMARRNFAVALAEMIEGGPAERVARARGGAGRLPRHACPRVRRQVRLGHAAPSVAAAGRFLQARRLPRRRGRVVGRGNRPAGGTDRPDRLGECRAHSRFQHPARAGFPRGKREVCDQVLAVRKLYNIAVYDDFLWAHATNDRIVDIAADLLGTGDIKMYADQLFMKGRRPAARSPGTRTPPPGGTSSPWTW